ncbi:MAG: flagellar biosynthesis protein FliQ [candidate division WS1 bacterium]|jgi:flagellar biosynthetic protein FliQ|nr:flagellar biosynthesis protein FliQ [candidate division WS1 bacterium]
MTDAVVLELLQQTFWVAFRLAGPVLAVALLVGVSIGLFQAITQIQEMTLTFVPKALAIALMVLLLGSWMMDTMMVFSTELIERMPELVR